MDDLLVLLGAGASLPGMLSTQEATQVILGQPAVALPGGRSEDLAADDVGHQRHVEAFRTILILSLRDLGLRIADGIDERGLLAIADQHGVNFEHLIHAAETLGGYFAARATGSRSFSLRAVLRPALELEAWGSMGALSVAVQNACYLLLDLFGEMRNRFEVAKHPQVAGLSALGSRWNLRTFSLNYDDLPFDAGLDPYTGFDLQGIFTPEYPWPRNKHCLCQLHGSVRWSFQQREVRAHPSALHAHKVRRAERAAMQHLHDGSAVVGGPKITGLRKADRLLPWPFGTYMHVFRDELLRCPRWLIVGYGFGDQHINECLSQAWSNLKTRTRPRAVVVDYFDPNHAGFQSQAPTMIRKKIRKVFEEEILGTEWGHMVSPSRLGLVHPSLAVSMGGTQVALGAGLPELQAWLRNE